jgi:hypothetical protein
MPVQILPHVSGFWTLVEQHWKMSTLSALGKIQKHRVEDLNSQKKPRKATAARRTCIECSEVRLDFWVSRKDGAIAKDLRGHQTAWNEARLVLFHAMQKDARSQGVNGSTNFSKHYSHTTCAYTSCPHRFRQLYERARLSPSWKESIQLTSIAVGLMPRR